MVDMDKLIQAARIVKDENGEPVVQITLETWEDIVNSLHPDLPQSERIKAVLKLWESIPDDKSPEWWDEFEQFLKDNRMNFPERDLGFGDE